MPGLVGTTVSYGAIAQLTPTSPSHTTTFEVSRTVVDPGVEYPDAASLFEFNTLPPGFGGMVNVSIDIGTNYIIYDYDDAGSGSYATGHQNTGVFTFASDLDVNIASARINNDLTTLNFDASDLRVEGNKLYLNFSGLSFNSGSLVRIDFDAWQSLTDVQSRPAEVSLVAATYQFFTDSIPTAAGFAYLISSSVNTNDLNDSYYEQFNTENRFINFANNLGSLGAGKGAFDAKYGALTFQQTIELAYDEIVGIDEARAAGINTDAAIDFLIGAYDFYAAVANERVVSAGISLDLAVKVVAIGSLLNESIKADVGVFADAIDALTSDVATDGYTELFGKDLFAAA